MASLILRSPNFSTVWNLAARSLMSPPPEIFVADNYCHVCGAVTIIFPEAKVKLDVWHFIMRQAPVLLPVVYSSGQKHRYTATVLNSSRNSCQKEGLYLNLPQGQFLLEGPSARNIGSGSGINELTGSSATGQSGSNIASSSRTSGDAFGGSASGVGFQNWIHILYIFCLVVKVW